MAGKETKMKISSDESVTNKNAERRRAAMRFLTSIPMDIRSFHQMHKERSMQHKKEPGIKQKVTKVKDISRKQMLTEKEDSTAKENLQSEKESRYLASEMAKISSSSVWGQRLKSQRAVHKMKHLKPKLITRKRVLLLDQSVNIPLVIFSVLPYQKHGRQLASNPTNIATRRRSRRLSVSRPLSNMSGDLLLEATLSIEGVQQPGKEEEVSYKTLLEESSCNVNIFDSSELENPEWKSGSHRTVLTFPSYMVSIIDYAKPTELKKDLNSRFQEKFPQVNITLSKCRSLKNAIQRIASTQNLDRCVTERAFSYFDRLVMSGKVIKENRRHCAGVCLLLSAKVNSDLRSAETSRLISRIEHGLKVGRHDLVLFEFPVFAALQFSVINYPEKP